MFSYQYKLGKLNCEACIKLVKMDLGTVKGITNIDLDIDGALELKADREIDKSEIVSALKDSEYKIL
ncbi:MAG: hypothetical protein Q8P62_03695 [Candidatus Peregrinibacteria bacterium]|nr:hypothetical protein [Candidatus Peregrinibacteria bacterium]